MQGEQRNAPSNYDFHDALLPYLAEEADLGQYMRFKLVYVGDVDVASSG